LSFALGSNIEAETDNVNEFFIPEELESNREEQFIKKLQKVQKFLACAYKEAAERNLIKTKLKAALGLLTEEN